MIQEIVHARQTFAPRDRREARLDETRLPAVEQDADVIPHDLTHEFEVVRC